MTLIDNIKLINGGGIFEAYAEDAILINGRVLKNDKDVGLNEHQYNYFYTRHDDKPINIRSAERPMSSNTPYEIASPKVLVLQFKEYDLNGIMYAVLNVFNGNYNRLRYEVSQVEIRKEIILKAEIGEVRPMDGYRLIKISYTEYMPLDSCEEITCNGDVVIPLTNDVKVYINEVLRYEPSCNTDLELTLVDDLGNPIDATYNGTEIVVDISCEDVRVSNSDDSYDVNVASGGDLELPDITVSNSDDSYSVTYPSVQNVELPDSQINVNGSNEGNVVSVKTIDVNITNGTNPVVPDAVSLSGNTLDIEVPSAAWERPDDWLAMPSVTSADDTFVGLHAVFDGGANFVAFTFTTDTGDYEVDWGDGNVDVVASNVQAQHQYDYSTYDTGNTTLSTKGYKQAIITVTPVSGELRTANFQKRYTTTPTIVFPYSSGFLDCILSMPNANTGRSITFGDTTLYHSMVERFDIKTIGNATSLQDMFQNCYSLQEVPLFDTSNITNMELMFYFCYSLQTIPLLDTSNVTNMGGMFYECYSLKTIPLLDTSNATNMASMFYFCRSLQTIPLLNTSNVTTVSNMFSNCFSLQEVPLFDTFNVTNMLGMFGSCYSLQSIPLFDTSNVANMQNMFSACLSLQEVPALDTTSVTNQTNQFGICQSLAKTDIICRKSVSFSRALLSQSELVNIFNNLIDLTGLTSQNINISVCWGASALTAAERQIATDKNWTITG